MNIRTSILSLILALPLLFTTVLFTTVLFITVSAPANAAEDSVLDEPVDNRSPRNALQENSINNLTSQPQPRVSRRQAMNLASGRYEGRVLGVVQLDNNNYRIRMDRDGTVFNVFVNASSGAVSASTD